MNVFIRKLLLPLPGLVRWYLSKKRTFRYDKIKVDVLPGVFHPGLFFSTRMLLDFVDSQPLNNTSFLELGAGTGIISLAAAEKGARVTATDINPVAIENIRLNAKKNDASIHILQSDLFQNIPIQSFDWILINPPYYPRKPIRPEDFAWYCGEHHEYFVDLFKGLNAYLATHTQVIMVLSGVCDLHAISEIGKRHGFLLEKFREKKVWADGKNYLFRLAPVK